MKGIHCNLGENNGHVYLFKEHTVLWHSSCALKGCFIMWWSTWVCGNNMLWDNTKLHCALDGADIMPSESKERTLDSFTFQSSFIFFILYNISVSFTPVTCPGGTKIHQNALNCMNLAEESLGGFYALGNKSCLTCVSVIWICELTLPWSKSTAVFFTIHNYELHLPTITSSTFAFCISV